MTVNIELFDSLDEVARDARGALDRSARPSYYDRLDWFRLVADHCPPSGRLLVLRAETKGRPGWLFLSVEGGVGRAFASWYSLRFASIGDASADVMTSFGHSLRDQKLARLDLAPVEQPTALAEGLRAAGWIVRVEPDKANWRVDTGGTDFAAYWESRPARLRNTFKRKAKAAGLEIEIHDRFSAEAWAAYEHVYRTSWKPEEGSFPFLRALAEQEGAAGALRLGIARKDGVPVAVQLWLVENGEATIHKLAYAEAAKALSPGTILGEAMFRHAIDTDRVRVIDYGLGDEGYKADWMGERRTMFRITAFNPRTVRGLAAAARATVGRVARRLRSR